MNWESLLTTFGLVVLAELGDKTQLAVLTQVCRYRQPWTVFLGASTALVGVTAIGATVGQIVGRLVPDAVIRIAAAILFVAMGILLGREALRQVKCGSPALTECNGSDQNSGPSTTLRGWRAFATTFVLLFVAEMGDKTQLAVFSLAGNQRTPWPVFIGGASALVLVTAVGVAGGVGLCRLIPERMLRCLSAVAFVIMGILIGLGVL